MMLLFTFLAVALLAFLLYVVALSVRVVLGLLLPVAIVLLAVYVVFRFVLPRID